MTIEDHERGTAYELVLPLVDAAAPDSFKSAATFTATFWFKDGAGPWSTFVPGDAFAEIATSGIYEITLSAAEMDHDYVLVKIADASIADTMIKIDMVNRNSDIARKILANDSEYNASTGVRTHFEDDAVTAFKTVTVSEPQTDVVRETVT